jgi:hypothetical protein
MDQDQQFLTYEILDLGHEPMTTPWNPNQNKLGTIIQINQY